MIIACDLDGTLTDGSGVISAENAGSLRWAKERGATCVLATSRPSRCLDLPMEQFALFDCVITCDGAELAAPEPAGIQLPLSPGAIHRAQRALRDVHITGSYAVEFGTCLGREDSYTGWPATDTGPVARAHSLQRLCELGPAARIFFRPDSQNELLRAVAPLTAAAGESITFTTLRQPQASGLVQFSNRGATKGKSLQAWLFSARRKGRLIVFGDQLNDLSMLEVADEAFAVGNANPDLRQRYTHLPNSDGSAVARAILERRDMT